jgi:malate:Na+ symporter
MNGSAEETAAAPELTLIQKCCALKVGPMPLLVYLGIFAVVFVASLVGKLPADMIGGFAVIMVMGWLLGDIGMNLPILKNFGGPAILSVFVPSILVYFELLNPALLASISKVMVNNVPFQGQKISGANFLYLYISCLVAGSILGMHRTVLIQGFLRMFIPLTVGTFAAIGAGVGVGLLFGYDPHHTFFFIVVPILGGGIGEGIIPYSIGMSEILGQPQSVFIPQLIPAAMLGNIIAIMTCGYLKRFGEKHQKYNGNGLLVKTGEDKSLLEAMNANAAKPLQLPLLGIGLLIACFFFIFGNLLSAWIAIPGAILMIFSAAVCKALKILPESVEQGAYQMYRFIASNLTWPLLVGLGVIFTPFKDVIAAITPAYICICLATVLSMISAGFFIGKFCKMYEVEAAIVTGCHSGLGGTGDVAILSACNRMELMPFAQISTRIGGALVVTIAIVLLRLSV